MENIQKSQVLSFLLDQAQREFAFVKNQYYYDLVKCKYDDDTDFVYFILGYEDSGLQIGKDAQYIGLVSYKTSRFYGDYYSLREMLDDTESVESIRQRMDADIPAAVRQLVDGKPVPVTDAADTIWNEEKRRLDHEQYYAPDQARKWFFSRIVADQYEPDMRYKNADTKKVIRFINDHDAFVAEESQAYVVKHAREINFELWEFEETRRQYEALESTPGILHLYRAIAESLTSDMKKVTIHLLKDGKTFAGKIEASALRRGDGCHYSDYSLEAADRRRFTEMFGRSAYINAEDIREITYGKKTLYERKDI